MDLIFMFVVRLIVFVLVLCVQFVTFRYSTISGMDQRQTFKGDDDIQINNITNYTKTKREYRVHRTVPICMKGHETFEMRHDDGNDTIIIIIGMFFGLRNCLTRKSTSFKPYMRLIYMRSICRSNAGETSRVLRHINKSYNIII